MNDTDAMGTLKGASHLFREDLGGAEAEAAASLQELG